MKIMTKLKKNALDIVLAIILFFITIAMLYPIVEQVAVSLSTPESLVGRPTLMWWPREFSVKAYQRIFAEADILSGYKNTIWIMFFGVLINLVMTMLGAYFMSRKAYKVKLKGVVTIVILFTMYFGGGLIPSFLLVKNLGLYNSRWALILPGAVSTYNCILLKSFFQTIPESLEESVELDGGGHFTILFKIIMPLSKPAMAVMAMYYGLGHWNSWFSAKIYLQDSKLYPLALILQNKMLEGNITNSGQTYVSAALYDELQATLVAALCITSTIPFLFIYPFLQKHFQGGLMIGSVKG